MPTSNALVVARKNPDLRSRLSMIYSRLGRRRALLLAGVVVAFALGTVLNWSWLIALGVAPVIAGLLPCIAMCGLGYCAMSMVQGKPTSTSKSGESVAPPEIGSKR